MSLSGLIGFPVSHSLSPAIHEYWMEKYQIEGAYKLFTTPPARLRQTILHMRKKGVVGVNITVPHKQNVVEYLDGLDDQAMRIGAVNTILNKNGKFIGSNTDAYGFISNLQRSVSDLNPYLKKVVILGAGGATRAAIVGLQDIGSMHITLVNRTEATAKEMAAHFGVNFAPWGDRETVLNDASLLINTTSLGMTGKPSLELDINHLPTVAIVHDIVYAPLQTSLLRDAAQRGNIVVDGLGMLLFQAQKAFELWHGILPEVTDELRSIVLAKKDALSETIQPGKTA